MTDTEFTFALIGLALVIAGALIGLVTAQPVATVLAGGIILALTFYPASIKGSKP